MSSIRFNVFTLLVAVGAAACDSGDPSGGVRQDRLTIQLTDAPGDLSEAHIRIEQIVLLGSGGTSRVEIEPEQNGYIDLLMLAGGQVLDIVDAEPVPAGTYSELRFVLGDAWVRLNDGRVFATSGATLPAGVTADGTLRCPSCSQSGFKVKFMNDPLQVSGETTVLVDFDVGQSFGHEAGQSGQWIMRPVLRATTRSILLARIEGTAALDNGVTLPECGEQPGSLARFRPFVVTGADTITATVDEGGAFAFGHLLPGSYSLGSFPHVTFTNGDTLTVAADPTPASVTLAEGDTATASYLITAATCH